MTLADGKIDDRLIRDGNISTFMVDVVEASRAVPVLVDFWADWCAPCRAIAPVIEELAADFEGQAKVGKVDVDSNAHVAAQYEIRSIPSLLLFKDGEVVDRVVGVVSKKVLADKLNGLAHEA